MLSKRMHLVAVLPLLRSLSSIDTLLITSQGRPGKQQKDPFDGDLISRHVASEVIDNRISRQRDREGCALRGR